jgi:hypothetical protein
MARVWQMLFSLGVALVGCNEPKCETEPFEGELLFTSNDAVGTISGVIQWPGSVEEGLLIELGVRTQTGVQWGALSSGGLRDRPETCGTELPFTIGRVDAGPSVAFAAIPDGGVEGDTASGYVWEAESDGFDVAEGNVSGLVITIR